MLNIEVRNDNSSSVDIRVARHVVKSSVGVAYRLASLCIYEVWLIVSLRNTW